MRCTALPGSLFLFRTPSPAPQVVPVCTRLMTWTPPVCICGCKNSKVVTQNEKCLPSGYVVLSILTTTPQRRRMNVEEEEVVLEILCETSFDWQHSVTVPKSGAFTSSWIHLSFGKSPPQPAASPPWDSVKKQQKKRPARYPCGTGMRDERGSRVSSQLMGWWRSHGSCSLQSHFGPGDQNFHHVSLIMFWAAADF